MENEEGKRFRITAIGPKDAYSDCPQLVGEEVILFRPLSEWKDGWMHGTVEFVKHSFGITAFHQIKLEPADKLESIKSIVMRRDEIDSDSFDEMLEGALNALQEGDGPEEVLSEWFGLEPDYVFELLELAATR